jgi:hypothetical protein
MSFTFKPQVFKAAIAAASVLSFSAFATLAGSAAVTASDLPDRVDSALLPQSVIEAAIVEQSSIPDRIELPEPGPVGKVVQPKATSLAALVAQHSNSSLF